MRGPTRDEAAARDRADPLASCRERFAIDPEGPSYLDGNSLGRLPLAAVATARRVVEAEWGHGLVESWESWLDLPRRVAALIAPLVGAGPDELILSDSTSVNLFKLAAAVLDAAPHRRVIITDDGNFPTDRYVLEGLARSRGGELRVVPADPVAGPAPEAVAAALDADVALVSLSHAGYRSAALADMAAINAAAHQHGARTLWDLSHSVGAVPIDLTGTGADLAVGCTYKYLSGGPGPPAFLYVRKELQGSLLPPIRGWFGHADQFAFEESFRPAPGIERFLVGSSPIIAITIAAEGIALVAEAGIDAIRAKSVGATALLIDQFDAALAPLGVRLGTPRAPAGRGSHVALLHPEGPALSRWLRSEAGVIADFRPPDVIRLAVAPLYTSFTEVWDAVEAMRHGLESGEFRHFDRPGRVP